MATQHDSAAYFDHPYFQARRDPTGAVRKRCELVFRQIGRATELGGLRGALHLDVGCDTGSFLLASQALYGTVPIGIDVAAKSVEVASRSGIRAFRGELSSLPQELRGFALITAIDVIEHIAQPEAFLREAWARLQPGGVLYIETPNSGSHVYSWGQAVSRITRGRPRALFERLFPREHVEYFSTKGLRTIASRCELQVLNIWSRKLAASDIAASLPVRAGVSAIQAVDNLSRTRLLLCMLAQRSQLPPP